MATAQQQLSSEKMQAFGMRILNDTAAAVRAGLNYIGDRLGIFKALASSGPITLEALSAKTNLNPRYLQEWLCALSAAEYLEYDAKNRTYFLPPEHALFLADENSPEYCGGALHMPVPLLSLAPEVMKAFRVGGGVHQHEHHAEMAEAIERFTLPFFTSYLTQQWLPSMPEVQKKLLEGCRVADVGCGGGQAVIAMGRAYPNSKIYGFDHHAPAIERAITNARTAGVTNVFFSCSAAETMSEEQKFDLVTTFDVIHDMADPVGGLKAIKGLLAKDGTYLMLEMNASDKLEENINPLGALLYSVSTLYCMTVSLAENGVGIGACMGEPKARQLTEQVGFGSFRKLPIEHVWSVLYEVRH